MSLQPSGVVDTSDIDPNGGKKPAANTPHGRCTCPVSAGMLGLLTGSADPTHASLLSPYRP